MPIGGVLAAVDTIVPNAVGVDIGCGMRAVRTNVKAVDLGRLELTNIMSEIRDMVPVGFNKHKSPCSLSWMPNRNSTMEVVDREFENARLQLGTLGGGNHFIEIQKDEEGYVWMMVHSGSRNLGKQVCEYYSKLAGEDELAGLKVTSELGQKYLAEMNFCTNFAYQSRHIMMVNMLNALEHEVGPIETLIEQDTSHNYVAKEIHFDTEVWVHRKGAVHAGPEVLCIIPGSQGSHSFIAKGLGNPNSFRSCSHGAGRIMSRAKARENLSLENEKKLLDDQGIVHAIRSEHDLDEAPSAYKNIDEVMENQKDLVQIIHILSPMAVVKG
jgi:tRNA-splicing ligase RtcB